MSECQIGLTVYLKTAEEEQRKMILNQCHGDPVENRREKAHNCTGSALL